MTFYPNDDRPGEARPSIAEIAALTRRLRELSAPGRAVDPSARAAFLADKDALLARITDTTTDADAATDTGGELHQHIARTVHADRAPEGEWWARAQSADPTVEAVTFEPAGYYSDAQLAAIAQARAAGDTDEAERLQDAPWSARTDDVEVPVMPNWMREQARRTEAAIADGTYVAAPPDDLTRFTDRLAALREHPDAAESGRRDQLARWHHDDQSAEAGPIADQDVADGREGTPGWDQ